MKTGRNCGRRQWPSTETRKTKPASTSSTRNLIQAQSQTNRSHVVINDALADLMAHLRVEDGGQPIAELMFRCGYISKP